jgi:hypothetical protein
MREDPTREGEEGCTSALAVTRTDFGVPLGASGTRLRDGFHHRAA